MSLLVDPEILSAFAGQVDVASDSIRGANVGTKAATAADSLQGSTTQWAARLIATHLGEQTTVIADNVTVMGSAVRGASRNYEVTDEALAGNFEGIF